MQWNEFLDSTFSEGDQENLLTSLKDAFNGVSFTWNVMSIYGAPASGKSTFARAIKSAFPDKVGFFDNDYLESWWTRFTSIIENGVVKDAEEKPVIFVEYNGKPLDSRFLEKYRSQLIIIISNEELPPEISDNIDSIETKTPRKMLPLDDMIENVTPIRNSVFFQGMAKRGEFNFTLDKLIHDIEQADEFSEFGYGRIGENKVRVEQYDDEGEIEKVFNVTLTIEEERQ